MTSSPNPLAVPAPAKRYWSPSKTGAATWKAYTFIVAVFLGLTIYTWEQWGDLRIDTGREMYVPAQLAHGKMLYRDLWYPYGPLPSYVQALFFSIFGVHLMVLYISGLALTLGLALMLFALSKRFLPPAGAAVVAFGCLIQAFNPDEFNYVLPYAHAATYGSLCGVLLLYFLTRHILGERGPNLVLSGLAAGLAVLAKQEFGIACWLVLAVAVVGDYWTHRSVRELGRQALRFIPGLTVFVLGFGWFVWHSSLRFILFKNFLVTPGSYYMRAFGAKWVAGRGLRFVPSEILGTMGIALLCMASWFCLAWAARIVFSKRRFSIAAVGGIVVAGGVAAAIGFVRHSHWEGYLFWNRDKGEFLFFPIGMFWLTCAVFLWKAIQYLRTRKRENLALAIVGAYALAIGIRIMVRVEPRGYPVYYSSIMFLVFVFVLVSIFRWVLRSLPPAAERSFLFGLLAVEAAGLFVGTVPVPFPDYHYPSTVHTDYGTIYTTREDAAVFPPVIAFMKEQKALGKHVLAIPEEFPLYFFAGMEAPSRWYLLAPGILPPEEEDNYIAGLERTGVDFILLSNRWTPEYGVPYFGLNYQQKVYRWIQDNYEVVGEFGHFVRKPHASYGLQVYRRRTSTLAAR